MSAGELVVLQKEPPIPCAIVAITQCPDGRIAVDYSDSIALLSFIGCPADVIKKFGEKIGQIYRNMQQHLDQESVITVKDILGEK